MVGVETMSRFLFETPARAPPKNVTERYRALYHNFIIAPYCTVFLFCTRTKTTHTTTHPFFIHFHCPYSHRTVIHNKPVSSDSYSSLPFRKRSGIFSTGVQQARRVPLCPYRLPLLVVFARPRPRPRLLFPRPLVHSSSCSSCSSSPSCMIQSSSWTARC